METKGFQEMWGTEAAVPVAACYVHNHVSPCLGLGAVQDALSPYTHLSSQPLPGTARGAAGLLQADILQLLGR